MSKQTIAIIGHNPYLGTEIIESLAKEKDRGIILVSSREEIGIKKLADSESFPIHNYKLPELIWNQPPLTRRERRKNERKNRKQ